MLYNLYILLYSHSATKGETMPDIKPSDFVGSLRERLLAFREKHKQPGGKPMPREMMARLATAAGYPVGAMSIYRWEKGENYSAAHEALMTKFMDEYDKQQERMAKKEAKKAG
jgi:hypothetical protein